MKYFILPAFLFFLGGCAASNIKLNEKAEGEVYPMYGKTPAREFYMDKEISDSLVLKWESEINGSFPNSSVTIYGKYIFASDLSGRIYCFDSATGKTAGQLKNTGAVYTSPVINNSRLIYAVADDDENFSLLFYYDFINGKIIKELELEGKVTTEIVLTGDGIILATEQGRIIKYSFYGEEIWQADLHAMVHSSPSLGGNIVVLGNDDGEITGINESTGKILYRQKIGDSFFGGSCIDNNSVYIGNDNGNLYSLDLQSGRINWQVSTGSRILMTPVYDKTNIIVGNLKGELFYLSKEGKTIWNKNFKGVLNTSPLLTANLIIQPDLFERYYFIDRETGEAEKILPLQGRAKLTPVIFNDLLFLGYDNGVLRAYEFAD